MPAWRDLDENDSLFSQGHSFAFRNTPPPSTDASSEPETHSEQPPVEEQQTEE
ncbi:MAG: hypothetical protein K0T00_1357 [Gaiellaceae bacterium]|nr:hypothetical protein [Gaiellaceae bacterium]